MTEHQQESQLITRNNNDLSNEPLGALPSVSSRVMIWRPKFLCGSDWLSYLPFALWRAEIVKLRILMKPAKTPTYLRCFSTGCRSCRI
jgi:hypothetical protein